MQLTTIIQSQIDNQQAFVAYRLPGEKLPNLMTGGIFSYTFQKEKTHFTLVPFDVNAHQKITYYYPELMQEGWNVEEIPTTLAVENNQDLNSTPAVINQHEYLEKADFLIKKIKGGAPKKVVLSRVLKTDLPVDVHFGKIFAALCEAYPKAFVYVLQTQDNQRWIGASPETLLSAKNKQAKTMALAGTQAVKEGCPTAYEWNEKELEEQAFVSRYIYDKLHQAQLNHLRQHKTKTILAGHVAHLSTIFEFELPAMDKAMEIALLLHPTPAVCGMSQKESFEMIRSTESHRRGLYTGFLGPVTAQQTNFFVNLRCMQILGNEAYIYVGGGLTADSVPQKEWEETTLKAQTMLSVIQNKL